MTAASETYFDAKAHPLVFSEEAIAQTLALARNDIASFSDDELRNMDDGMLALHNRYHLISPHNSPDEVATWRAGYVMAHAVLREAAIEARLQLPDIPKALVLDYAAFVANPGCLEDDFTRDYIKPGHLAVVGLVEHLRWPSSTIGAKTMFGLRGRQANPWREPIAVPKRVAKRAESRARVLDYSTKRTRR